MAMAEITIYGAGIFGLSIAWSCQSRGARVQVIDPSGPGAGASGGIVGALAPHVPENWNDKKAFQLDSLLMAENTSVNNWQKCEDDSAKHFDWIAEANVMADGTGDLDLEIDLGYLNPLSGMPFSAAQVEAMRGVIAELSITTRMVANTVDDDNLDFQNTMMQGHEVYIMGASMQWTLLTPGNDGECGDSTMFPLAGSEAGYYLWHSTAAGSQVDGSTGLTDADITGLGIGDLIPSKARLVVMTGGGVAFGWEKEVFLVR